MDELRKQLVSTKNKYFLAYEIVREDDPNQVDVVIIGRWRNRSKTSVEFHVDVGNVNNKLMSDLESTNLTVAANTLPEKSRWYIFEVGTILRDYTADNHALIYDSLDPFSKEIGKTLKGNKIWVLARIHGTKWSIVQIKDKISNFAKHGLVKSSALCFFFVYVERHDWFF